VGLGTLRMKGWYIRFERDDWRNKVLHYAVLGLYQCLSSGIGEVGSGCGCGCVAYGWLVGLFTHCTRVQGTPKLG
jgi:hypothetical protein